MNIILSEKWKDDIEKIWPNGITPIGKVVYDEGGDKNRGGCLKQPP